MNIKAFYRDGLLTIGIIGELDHHAAKKAVSAIERNIDDHLPKSLVLDFKELSFMDSSGIAVILKAYRRMNELGGQVLVENVPSQPQKVINAAGLDRLVKIAMSSKEGYI